MDVSNCLRFGEPVTYSSDHVTDDQRLTALLDTLIQDVSELRHMLIIYGDVMDLPGRRPAADPDRTGRQATHVPSRPTEDIALDESRQLLRLAVQTGVRSTARAIALVRGTSAEMDRALGKWEGDVSADHGDNGGLHGCAHGTAGDYRAA